MVHAVDDLDRLLEGSLGHGHDRFQSFQQFDISCEHRQGAHHILEGAKVQGPGKSPIDARSAMVSLLREYLISVLFCLNWKKAQGLLSFPHTNPTPGGEGEGNLVWC